jgi:hypothetical protein
MERALRFFQGATNLDIFDNMKAVVKVHTPAVTVFNSRFLAYAGARQFGALACNVARGNEKGIVERLVGFVRERFWRRAVARRTFWISTPRRSPGATHSPTTASTTSQAGPRAGLRARGAAGAAPHPGGALQHRRHRHRDGQQDIPGPLRSESVLRQGHQPPVHWAAGQGQDFLARALAYRACQAQKRVVVTSAPRTLTDLHGADVHCSLERALRRYVRADLLAIDDFAVLAMDGAQAKLAFQVIAERYDYRC